MARTGHTRPRYHRGAVETIRPRKPGPPLVVGLVVLAIGALVAVPSLVVIVSRTVRVLSAAAVSTPGTTQRHLTPGTWLVFQRTGTKTGVGGLSITRLDRPGLQPVDVTVTGPEGPVPVQYARVSERLTEGTRVYTSQLEFDVATAGTYTVRVVTAGPSEIVVTRSLSDTYQGAAAYLLGSLFGGLLVVLGVVLVIVGSVRRNRVGLTPAGWAPMGWYPDPYQPGRMRWWDGGRWTEHQG